MNPSVSFACGVSLAFLKIYFTNFLALVCHKSSTNLKSQNRTEYVKKRVLIEAKAQSLLP